MNCRAQKKYKMEVVKAVYNRHIPCNWATCTCVVLKTAIRACRRKNAILHAWLPIAWPPINIEHNLIYHTIWYKTSLSIAIPLVNTEWDYPTFQGAVVVNIAYSYLPCYLHNCTEWPWCPNFLLLPLCYRYWSLKHCNHRTRQQSLKLSCYLVIVPIKDTSYLNLLCIPVLTPHMTGLPTFPGEVTENWSIMQSPMDPPKFGFGAHNWRETGLKVMFIVMHVLTKCCESACSSPSKSISDWKALESGIQNEVILIKVGRQVGQGESGQSLGLSAAGRKSENKHGKIIKNTYGWWKKICNIISVPNLAAFDTHPAYTAQLLTLHQHRANYQYSMMNQIQPTLRVSSNSQTTLEQSPTQVQPKLNVASSVIVRELLFSSW